MSGRSSERVWDFLITAMMCLLLGSFVGIMSSIALDIIRRDECKATCNAQGMRYEEYVGDRCFCIPRRDPVVEVEL